MRQAISSTFCQCGAGLEGALAAALNYRPIGNGVAERYAEFDQIGAPADHCCHQARSV
jgi:hypothetical protein